MSDYFYSLEAILRMSFEDIDFDNQEDPWVNILYPLAGLPNENNQ